jgi:Fe-S-cluster containining protein
MSRNERRLAKKAAPRSVAEGIDPSALDEFVMTELAKQLYTRLDQAKRSLSIDATVDYLFSKIDLTTKRMSDVRVACGKGCSHCCNIWVSVTAPEVFYVAKRLSAQVPDRVREANELTKSFSHEQRPYHPNPCPLLQNNQCSIYEFRPLFCRLAASFDAEVCRRSYSNITDEGIPTPVMYMSGRDAYSTALTVALKGAGLPHLCYEFNSALNIALTTPAAEKAWLTGNDIFAAAVKQDDAVPFEESPGCTILYDLAFS